MNLHVFEFGNYGVIASSAESAIDVLRSEEGDDAADDIIEQGERPIQLPDNLQKTIDLSRDEHETCPVTMLCAEWIANAESDILWRPA